MKILYQPWQELVIHEVHEMDVKSFLEGIANQVKASGQVGVVPMVNWVDGVAFIIGVLPETEDIVRDKLNGRLHYAFVSFTRTSYEPEKNVEMNGHKYVVRLQKAEMNRDLVDLADFLKRNFSQSK